MLNGSKNEIQALQNNEIVMEDIIGKRVNDTYICPPCNKKTSESNQDDQAR